MRLLVIEDSSRLRRSLKGGLSKSGFSVRTAANGEEGLELLAADSYDVLVLDLMLPGISGLEVLQRIRAEGWDVHVLILSARDGVEDRVKGLDLGADDYLVKPFALDELCSRVNALVRRRYQAKTPVVSLGAVEVDTTRKSVSVDGEEQRLTPSEYSVFEYLVLRRGMVTSQDQIIDHLYYNEDDVSSNVIEVIVSGLRKKIHRPGQPPVIVTRRGFGYVVE